MKRYRFRLEGVLRLRRMEEEQAKEALQLANEQLRELVHVRDGESRRYRALVSGADASTPADFQAERQDHVLAAASLEYAEVAVQTQATRAALAQLAYREAARRVEALLRLDARQRAEHDLAVRRDEGRVVDDLVTARYVRDRAVARARGRHHV